MDYAHTVYYNDNYGLFELRDISHLAQLPNFPFLLRLAVGQISHYSAYAKLMLLAKFISPAFLLFSLSKSHWANRSAFIAVDDVKTSGIGAICIWPAFRLICAVTVQGLRGTVLNA